MQPPRVSRASVASLKPGSLHLEHGTVITQCPCWQRCLGPLFSGLCHFQEGAVDFEEDSATE